MVSVPANLCARVPDAVSDDEAAFTVLGAIALQGIRLAEPTLGETVVVIGLGLIGLVTVQTAARQRLPRARLDFDADRLALARRFGADVGGPVAPAPTRCRAATRFSRGRGVDAVLITAGDQEQRAGAPGGADVPQARPHRAGRRRPA